MARRARRSLVRHRHHRSSSNPKEKGKLERVDRSLDREGRGSEPEGAVERTEGGDPAREVGLYRPLCQGETGMRGSRSAAPDEEMLRRGADKRAIPIPSIGPIRTRNVPRRGADRSGSAIGDLFG